MNNNKKSLLILLALLALTLGTSMASLRKEQGSTYLKKKVDESQFPIADYEALEPADPTERNKRHEKGQKFHQRLPVTRNPNFSTAATVYHWPLEFPSIPAIESKVIVSGFVTDSKAYLSSDKTDVYSEFTVRVKEVLKDDTNLSLLPNCSIIVTRRGGRVRFSDGSIQLIYDTGLGMPRPGLQYLFFLNPSDQDFDLITAYELRSGRVFAIDNGTPNFSIHDNTTEESFLSEVRLAITSSSR